MVHEGIRGKALLLSREERHMAMAKPIQFTASGPASFRGLVLLCVTGSPTGDGTQEIRFGHIGATESYNKAVFIGQYAYFLGNARGGIRTRTTCVRGF